jgi:hypothetical protein
MVANQPDTPVIHGEGSHTIRVAGSEKAVGHMFALVGNDAVAKAIGQIENALGVCFQWAVANCSERARFHRWLSSYGKLPQAQKASRIECTVSEKLSA